MDRLKTTDNGGFPLRLDDFRWMLGQASNHGIYEALNHVLRGFGDNFVVQGCIVSGTSPNVAITEGWIMLSGELLKVDAQSSINTTTDNTFIKQTTFDATGNKTFQDLSTNDTYQKDRGVVSGTGGTLAHDGVSLNDLLGLSAWTSIDLESSANVVMNDDVFGTGIDTAFVNQPNAGSFFKYKIVGKTLHYQFSILQVGVISGSSALAILVKNLPFTFNGSQRGSYFARATSASGAMSGIHPSAFSNGSDMLRLNLMWSTGTSFLKFDTVYEADAGVTFVTDLIPKTQSAQPITWDFSGDGTLELN